MPSFNTHEPQIAKKKQSRVILKRRYISDVVEVEEKPPPKPPKVHDTGVSDEVLEGLTDAFELLYNPNYFGHLEFEEQIKKFKSRDLLEAKLYKTALKAFGNQRFVRERLAKDNGRKRVFVAQPLSELRGFDSFSSVSCLPKISSDSRNADSSESDAATAELEDPAAQEMSRYQQWLKKRQVQHRDLERMGDVERYLRGKGGQLSSMERATLHKIEESRRPKEVEQVVEEAAEVRTRPPSKVSVKRPSPLALFIIDGELRKRKLRLSDLFTSIDKDKDWLLTRDEFRKAMRQNRVPLPEPLLEDMIITLDQDNNNQLDYRELAQGLEQYRRERRSPEFLALLSEESNQFLLARGADTTGASSPSEGDAAESPSGDGAGARSPDSATAGGPAGSATAATASGAESQLSTLRPGEFDTSQERYSVNNAEASAELRRRDRVALRYMRKGRHRGEEFRSMVKTFDRDIDDHVTPSSLPERPLAEQVDAYRQRQLREFMSIVEACKERGVVFSERLCRRVFLHPADRTRKQIGQQVAPLGSNPSELPSSALLPPGQRATLAAAAGGRRGGDTGAVGVTGGGAVGSGAPWWRQGGGSGGGGGGGGGGRASNMARLGRALPTRRDLLVDDDDAEVELPTGTAVVRRKVDCWLTLRGVPATHRQDRLFETGRVRRFLESGLDGASAYGPQLMFQATQPARGGRSHPYLPKESWPVVGGHVTYGSIDPTLAHEITGPRRLQQKLAH
uniref:EF-hand domain-containing protein n=1 Tax=Macrostomum lignano TaxID=282301 RepID=A0A1I8GJL7_9PLAT